MRSDPSPPAPAEMAPLQAAWRRAYAGDLTADDLAPALGPSHPIGRGGADALAAWRRWHPSAVDGRFSAAEWPWYAILERARVESLASRDLPGMALNLADLETLAPANADGRATQLYRLARQRFDRPKPVAGPPEAGLPIPRPPNEERIASHLERVRPSLCDPTAFAAGVLPLVRELAAAGEASPLAHPPAGPPTPLALARDAAREPSPDEAQPHPDDEASPDDESDALNETASPAAGATEGPPVDRRYPGYAIFTRRWDQVLDAAQLYQPGDALNLRPIPEPDQLQARRLALRLQRRLLAARLRRWSFDLDEGRLDSRRLSRLLSRRPPFAVFRQEDEAPLPEACVTLLVDQSGSMRGLPQRLTAQAIDLAARTLEIAGIRCEVLGFTTRFGADNPLMRAWRAAGQPPRPGRLNAPRHLIYKGADQPWRQRRLYLGLLLREGLGRENLDGEALDWAARRLLARPEPRKVLIVLCDGAPLDEATVAANGRRFLEDHLRAVIAAMESSLIHLAAIGAGGTVGRFYRQALSLYQPDQVADMLFQHLGDLLNRPHGQSSA